MIQFTKLVELMIVVGKLVVSFVVDVVPVDGTRFFIKTQKKQSQMK
jgi:hypothetical protein